MKLSGTTSRNFLRALLFSLCLGTSAASIASTVTLTPSKALACLSLLPGAPSQVNYPELRLQRKEEAKVQVELEFKDAESPPKIKVLSAMVYQDFIDAIEAQAQFLRVPCMTAEQAPVRLQQSYNFSLLGNRVVKVSLAIDVEDRKRKEMLSCLVHQDPGSKPNYPVESRRRGEEGVVIVNMRFVSPDQAPITEVLPSTRNRQLRQSVAGYVEGLRMPCLQDSVVDTFVAYKFLLRNNDRTILRDMDLIDFLRNAKDLKTPVEFNFNQMSCPFDVKLSYFRPYKDNILNELDNTNAARLPFFKWLAQTELNITNTQLSNVLSDSMVIHVPCGQLQL